ncbi:MAG: hypothetical protein IPL52_11440, partial [Flavobacteriales bacterium]|nr:hypothetical protein [Flavobacteriales bacterium]
MHRARERDGSRTALVVFCQHGITDPLTGPLMLDYVRRVQQVTDGFHAVHHRRPPGAIVPSDLHAELMVERIRWMPLRYDVGGRQWAQRIGNLWRMLRATRSFVRDHERRWLLGYLSYGGSYAIIASMLGMGPCAVVCFEPHSRYMTEMGIWPHGALRTRVTSWLERLQMKHSRALVVPTRAVQDLVLRYRANEGLVLQGITIDTRRACFDAEARASLRREHRWEEEIVLVYVGKFGGIYHSIDDYLRFAQQVAMADAGMRFFIISQQAELDRLRAHHAFASIADRIVLQPPVPSTELHRYLSAADVGVVAIPPSPSQAYRTPVKSAHYWAAG